MCFQYFWRETLLLLFNLSEDMDFLAKFLNLHQKFTLDYPTLNYLLPQTQRSEQRETNNPFTWYTIF